MTDLRGSDGTGHVSGEVFVTASEVDALAVVASCLQHIASGGIVACWRKGVYDGDKITLYNNLTANEA